MPCDAPQTSPSHRRKHTTSSSPPRSSATLDLTLPAERWIERFLRWAATGPHALLKALAIKRTERAILVAVEWLDWPHDEPLALLEIALSANTLHWQGFSPSRKGALLSLVSQREEPTAPPTLAFGMLLRLRREQAGMCRFELAAKSGLSWGTIRNLETARTYPSRLTLRALQRVSELGLREEDLPPPLRGRCRPSWQQVPQPTVETSRAAA